MSKSDLETLMSGDTSVINPNGRINFTLKDLLMLTTSGLINLSPEEYQRYFRATLKFSQQLIKTIFIPKIIIPEMTLRFGCDIPRDYKCEVMDGQQRSTSCKLFYENEYSLPNDEELACVSFDDNDEFTYDLRGKYFKQLPKVARKHFENYVLTAQTYVDISSVEAGELFVNILNNVTKLEAQEKRQAISSSMSRFVQEKSRFKPYPVFKTKDKNDMVLQYLIKAKHEKLDIDKHLAELIYMTTTDDYKTKGVTNKCMDNFYISHASRKEKKFNSRHIDTLMRFGNQALRGVPQAQQILTPKLFRNFCVIVSEHIKEKISLNPINFMNVYIQAVENLSDKSLRAKDLHKTPFQFVNGGTTVTDTVDALNMLRNEMTKIGYEFTELDSERTFSRDVVRKAYYKQDGKCNICGEEMPEFGEDIHGDHILLYKDGNPTIDENCAAVHASCNFRKSA